MNKKIIYITGCLGFIGSHLTERLLNDGHYIIGVDKITYASNKYLIDEFSKYENFKFEKIDICDIKRLYDCDYIINCAAETHVDNSIIQNKEFIHSNIDGVHNLLENIRNNYHYKMPTLIHFSTDEVYGDSINGEEFTEEDLLKPSNPYSASKAAADMLIIAWSRTYGIPYIIVRPTNNYGTRQHIEKLIPKSIKFLQLERKIPLHNNGIPQRTWLNVKDTCDAICTILEKGKINSIYNITSKEEKCNYAVVSKIIKEYFYYSTKPVEEYIDYSYNRKGQDERYIINCDKLFELGWKPKIKFDKEIKNIVEYYRDLFIW